jgi:hypothetical protein
MRPVLVVIAHIFGHQPLQMPLIQDDHMVQQVASAAPHPTLGNTVLPPTAKGSAGGLASQIPHGRNQVSSVLGVAIEQKESVRRHERLRPPQLLHDPEGIRISCHVETAERCSS